MNPVYQYVTDAITERLKSGVIPWQKTWKTKGGMPKNLVSKKAYSGINVWMLGSLGYANPYFVSYKQAQALKGQVKKGEKGHLVVFWSMLDKEKDGEKTSIPMLRYYKVFNVSQCDGIETPHIEESKETVNPLEACDSIVNGMPKPPTIESGKDKAYYMPSRDLVGMPDIQAFKDSEAYYATFFHELAHSTGHNSRLNRKGIEELAGFGTKSYSQEELVAEMTASFLCGEAGIFNSVADNSAAYIQGWLSKLANDPKILVHAAGQAQKAANFILNIQPETK